MPTSSTLNGRAAALLPILRHDVAELLRRAEQLAECRGSTCADLVEYHENELLFATIPIHDCLREYLALPWDPEGPVDASNGACWLRELLEGTESKGPGMFPEGWETHAERLSSPGVLTTLRVILSRLGTDCRDPGAPRVTTPRREPKASSAMKLDDLASALLTKWIGEGRPKLSKRAIARELGCHPSSLRDCPLFSRLWAVHVENPTHSAFALLAPHPESGQTKA